MWREVFTYNFVFYINIYVIAATEILKKKINNNNLMSICAGSQRRPYHPQWCRVVHQPRTMLCAHYQVQVKLVSPYLSKNPKHTHKFFSKKKNNNKGEQRPKTTSTKRDGFIIHTLYMYTHIVYIVLTETLNSSCFSSRFSSSNPGVSVITNRRSASCPWATRRSRVTP